MKSQIEKSALDAVLEQMGISDISCATIRQSGEIARTLEKEQNVEFLHLEMGIPGLPPARIGVEAECEALRQGIASVYPNMMGTPELKKQASRFLKAFLDIDVAPKGCIPTVGSMQGSFSSFIVCSHLDPAKDTILFIDPGFPVQRSQARLLGIRSESFDIYDYRGEKLAARLESHLSSGRISAIIYSSPNNPAWFNLAEDELKTIGEMATRYDAVVIEDLAYMCMDFRKPLGKPYEPPFQPTVAKYTDNYIIMMSASKMFSYAGQRIAVLAISDNLYKREYPALQERYRIARLGDALVLGILYAVSSGTSHSAQFALAAMLKAAADGELDFVADTAEYARRASLTKKMFLDNGFHIVYSKDGDEDVSDGFFYTVGYGDMTGAQLMNDLMLCGICSISLSLTGSSQNGVRICVSQLNRPEQFELLKARLELFKEEHS
ncbi:MAG: pyridoxal phosphate-dependent aminotransferase [Bacteroidales bacterium]|nr:pyridoxal phosphate-dependent aminotransferase [Bacteroidales bacterium]